MRPLKTINIIRLLAFIFFGCRQVYEPPAIIQNNSFLVVDGFINTTPESATIITLTRTRNLSDTIPKIIELHAQVAIESKSGNTFQLQEQGSGIYIISHTAFNASDMYRLRIKTTNGSQYLSDFVPVKQTPPIDSLEWQQQNDVTVYTNTHDPQNNTWYYRWDYTETWEYHAAYETPWGVKNDIIFAKPSFTDNYQCWRGDRSTTLVTGTSIKLGQDVVAHVPVAIIPQNSSKITVRYSIFVNQYALTQDAYAYWQVLQKNTQQLGTLFDAQPSQLKSNIHCLTNPNEPVLGYISASTVQQKRLFINYRELSNWNPYDPSKDGCSISFIGYGFNDFPQFTYPDTTYAPYYFSGNTLFVAPARCLDCRIDGGTSVKPSYW